MKTHGKSFTDTVPAPSGLGTGLSGVTGGVFGGSYRNAENGNRIYGYGANALVISPGGAVWAADAYGGPSSGGGGSGAWSSDIHSAGAQAAYDAALMRLQRLRAAPAPNVEAVLTPGVHTFQQAFDAQRTFTATVRAAGNGLELSIPQLGIGWTPLRDPNEDKTSSGMSKFYWLRREPQTLLRTFLPEVGTLRIDVGATCYTLVR